MTDQPPQLRDQAGVRWTLRIGGAILAPTGLVLLVIGVMSIVRATGFSEPKHAWLMFIGIPMLGIGLMMLMVGFIGPTTRYVAGEVGPTARDSLRYVGIRARRRPAMCAAGHFSPPGSGVCVVCGQPIVSR